MYENKKAYGLQVCFLSCQVPRRVAGSCSWFQVSGDGLPFNAFLYVAEYPFSLFIVATPMGMGFMMLVDSGQIE